MCNWNTKGKKKEKQNRKIFEVTMAENFPKLMRTPNHRSGRLREHQAEKVPNKSACRHIIFKLQDPRNKEKVFKKPEERTPYVQRKKNKNYSGLLICNHAK